VLGQTEANLNAIFEDSTLGLSTGAYIVKIQSFGKMTTHKILLNKKYN
jgi:hypothetical protein